MTREEAIRRIKAWNLDSDDMEVLAVVIPELAENEDERIRKALIKLMTVAGENYVMSATGFEKERLISYLEKQQEQNVATINGEPIPTENHSINIPLAEWSEEDEKIRQSIIKDIEWDINYNITTAGKVTKKYNEQINWLKTLPERFNLQPKEEWSEEDEEIFNNIIEKTKGGHWIEVNEITWLITRFKSLRPQYHGDVTMTEAYKMGLEAGKASSWKPTEEQMKALERTTRLTNFGLEEDRRKTLIFLYEQLKKLM